MAGAQPLNPTNANRYAYTGDNPINATDPSGKFSLSAYLCDEGFCGAFGIGVSDGTFSVSLGFGVGFGGGFTYFPDGGSATQPVSVDISCGLAGLTGDFNSTTGSATAGQNDSASIGCSLIGYVNGIYP